jgi:MOSC domain-containing protein YiiM
MEEVREARILADFGLEGCAHGQAGGNRQILLVDRETLDAMELQPGVLRENITTNGLNVNSLRIGQQLRIGEALLEVTMVCTPAIRWSASGQGCGRNSGAGAACCAACWKVASSAPAIRS